MPSLDQLSPAIAKDLSLPEKGVRAVVQLLSVGATVPFIARYRKEATGSLDEVQIRAIEDRLAYRRELEERRSTILAAIDAQGKLTADLASRIQACQSKTELEDLYLPYKAKRRTRASMARERGLEPLALRIASQPPHGNPRSEAARYVSSDKDVADVEAALAGARDILAEQCAEQAQARAVVRRHFQQNGALACKVTSKAKAKKERTKFEQYYDFSQPLRGGIPSHRYLAIRRGEEEGGCAQGSTWTAVPCSSRSNAWRSCGRALPSPGNSGKPYATATSD